MKRPLLLLTSTLTLESLLGCGYTEFPQYSGRYKLQQVSYTDPSLVGEKQMPLSLDLVDRMEYIGIQWNHRLLFNFIPDSQDQADGIFGLSLNEVTRIDQGVWPNDWYDGAEIYREPTVYGPGAWCNRKYIYLLYLDSVPAPEVLKGTYPGYDGSLGKNQTTQMDLKLSLQYPEEVEFDDSRWYDAVEENEGITLYLTFTRYRREKRGDFEECILSPDSRGEESLTFTYHADLENLDDETDIREGGIAEVNGGQPPVSFFRKVVSSIK